MTLDTGLLLAAGAFIALLIFRLRRRLNIDQVYRVSPEDLWDVVVPRRSRPNHLEDIATYEWNDSSETDALIKYKAGLEARFWQRIDEEKREVAQILDLLDAHGRPYERLNCFAAVVPDEGGARLRMTVEYEKLARRPISGWLNVMTRPLTSMNMRFIFASALEKSGATARYHALHGPAEVPRSVLGMRMSWTALLLAAIAIGWWGWLFGPWFAAALVVGLVLHEAGHVAVMRAFGDKASAFFFVPFLGGVAIGRMPHAHDWQHAAMVLGGPAAGLASALAAYGLGTALDNSYLLGCAYLFAILNLVNLATIPPLDGGQLALLVLRPFVSPSILKYSSAGLAGVGIGLSWSIGSALLAALFAFFLFIAVATPAKAYDGNRRALSLLEAAAVVAAFLLLAAALAAIVLVLHDDVSALTALISGPSVD